MIKIKKFLKIKYFVILVVLLVIGLIIYNVRFKEKVIKAELVNFESQEIFKTVSASGGVESRKTANLSFGASTKITNLNFSEGQKVTQGQYLARGDSLALWQSSQSTMFLKEQAIIDQEKYVDDFADNLEAAGGRDEYERQLQKRRDIVNQYNASYQSSVANLSGYSIYSPFEGTVVEVDKEVGEIAAAGSRVVKIADLNSIYFEALVDQEDLGSLKEGQETILRLDSYPDKEFKGKVTRVPNYIPENSQNIKVEISIDNDLTTPILYGMVGDVEIVIEKKASEVALPFQYVITDDSGKEFVWTMDENDALKKEYVEVALEGDLYYELNTDLKEKRIISLVDTKEEPEEGTKVVLEVK